MEQSELTSHFGFEIKLFSTGMFTTLLFEFKKKDASSKKGLELDLNLAKLTVNSKKYFALFAAKICGKILRIVVC